MTAKMHAEASRRFLAQWRATCACAPLELRQERGGLICEACGAPVVARADAAPLSANRGHR